MLLYLLPTFIYLLHLFNMDAPTKIDLRSTYSEVSPTSAVWLFGAGLAVVIPYCFITTAIHRVARTHSTFILFFSHVTAPT